MSIFRPGDVVEWAPLYAGGMMRGTVSRVVAGTVFLFIDRAKPNNEVWFEPSESHRLKILTRKL